MKTAKKGSPRSGVTSTTSAPSNFVPYNSELFRAFSTVQPSQDLLDDLLPSFKERKSVESFYYLDEISPSMKPLERVLRRSDQQVIQQEISSKFHPQKWYASRFSDGTWPVLYSAEAEETALRECLYHKRRFYLEELRKKPVLIDLRVAVFEAGSKQGRDLLREKNLERALLISQDESGYPYCQALAKASLQTRTELFRAPSARHQDGVCVPVFSEEAVRQDKGHLKYAKCVMSLQKTEVFGQERAIAFESVKD